MHEWIENSTSLSASSPEKGSLPGITRDDRGYYVTLLSNFARGYDKYSREYRKDGIPESRFPDRFYLLPADDLAAGINKAVALKRRLALPGDAVLAMRSNIRYLDAEQNTRTQIGRVIPSGALPVDSLFLIESDGTLLPLRESEAYARSLALITPTLEKYQTLAPRTISILPIGKGCQAACHFCFSEASVSKDQSQRVRDWARIEAVLDGAKARGAERAVVSGGGEPTLLPERDLLRLIEMAAQRFSKVVLITNGYTLGHKEEASRLNALVALRDAGLSILSISRHHDNDFMNRAIMGVATHSEKVAECSEKHRKALVGLTLRWICVLQKGGIDSAERLDRYLRWSVRLGIAEINFKELYVSSSRESIYHNDAANEWSHHHHVPLRLVLDAAERHGWRERGRLPWGAPIFRGNFEGAPMQVAAYTEPSVFWERSHGIARSWNLMADGTLLASLEDSSSRIDLCA